MFRFVRACILLSIFFSSSLWADGSSIDKVYQPYVNPLEKEIEYRVLMENNNVAINDDFFIHKFGYGQAITQKLFLEGYVVSSDYAGVNPKTDAYELELRYQMTERGQYRIDWGSMYELEKYARLDKWEARAGLLASGQWKRLQNTFNIFIINEWGGGVQSELESSLAFQSIYRLSPSLEPGIELYANEDTSALGPMISGRIKMDGARKLFWEFAVIHGMRHTIPNNTFKFQLEYEFI